MMGKRVTIVLKEDLVKRIRTLQAKRIKNSQSSVSFSKTVSDVVEKGLRSN